MTTTMNFSDGVCVARIANIMKRPFADDDIDISGAHTIAMIAAKFMVTLDTDGKKMTPVLYDRTSHGCARISVHRSLTNLARKDDAEPDAVFEFDELPPEIAMMVMALLPTERFAIWYVRDAAWEWMTTRARIHDVSIGRIIHKAHAASIASYIAKHGEDDGVKMAEQFVHWSRLIASTPANICEGCGGVGRRLCQGTGCIAQYCSRACQVGDWQRHKTLCRRTPPPSMFKVDMSEFIEFLAGDDRGDEFCSERLRLHAVAVQEERQEMVGESSVR